ncbi:MAG: preprotein translocase subunit SecG [Deltaproteobacteria bacterium]|nr:preprotein translocase subunit SecG [Deltaproteobacteria bacterium]
MRLIVVFIHLAVCIALIMIVLLQKGKGANMGAAFGGSSQTVFGSAGASSFLQKITVAAAVIFMLTSLTLALLFGRGVSTSVMRGVSPPIEAPLTQQTESASPEATPSGAPAPAEAAKD